MIQKKLENKMKWDVLSDKSLHIYKLSEKELNEKACRFVALLFLISKEVRHC